MDDITDAPEVLETPAEHETADQPVSPDAAPELTAEEQVASLQKEKSDLEKKNKQLFERAKKAEAAVPKEDGITAKDTLALVGAGITIEEDIDEVVAFAGYRKVSVVEALKDKTLQSILTERKEERKTASASNTKSARGTSKATGADLIERARSGGEIPESDIDKLTEARIALKKAKQ